MADIVQFEFGQPVEVALKFPEPKVFDGQYGERCMYSLTDGRVMYVDPLTAARIKSLGVQPGEMFFVLKSKKGRSAEWSVFRDLADAPETPAYQRSKMKPHERAARLPELVAARNTANNLESQLAASLAQVAERKMGEQPDGTFAVPNPSAPAPRPPARERWTEVLLAQTNALTDVLAEALRHSSQHGGLVKTDDVRSLLITTFIELSKRREANRAA
jgi:hypothetical protein